MSTMVNIRWQGDAQTGYLQLLDQTLLPAQQQYLDCKTVEDVWGAIRRLSVRGAPAIGIAAAFGCVIGAQRGELEKTAEYLATSRPTAVNLFWAIERMKRVAPSTPQALFDEALRIHEEDAAMCRQIGKHGLAILSQLAKKPLGVLTHCNAGALATGGIGTATAPMYLAHEQGLKMTVYADETRPLLQGARLTALELQQAGVDVVLLCDNMAASAMAEGRIDVVIVGADRIASNGDAANKIGTYNVAVLAKHHGVPFYVAAPSSTFDLSLPTGADIPIEHRGSEEVTHPMGTCAAPSNVRTYSPAFDVTPHELIAGIITERGVISPVDEAHVRAMISTA